MAELTVEDAETPSAPVDPLPCGVVVPLALGLVGSHVAVGWLVWPLVAAVFWQLAYESREGATT
jgi:hypothetical protein